MKLHYKGRFDGREESLPHGEHKPNAVKFKEPETPEKLARLASTIAIVLSVIALILLFVRGGLGAFRFQGCLLAVLVMYPHEFLHGICFKKDAYIYTNLKQGMLFIVGPEDMSKARFILMSLFPNLVFGFLPFIFFLICPEFRTMGTLGVMAIGMGAGDYLNVYNAITQMPKGARTYLYGFHSYWYVP